MYYQNHHATRDVSGWETPASLPGALADGGARGAAVLRLSRSWRAARTLDRAAETLRRPPEAVFPACRRRAARADPAAPADARLPVLRETPGAGLRRGGQAAAAPRRAFRRSGTSGRSSTTQSLQRLRHRGRRALAQVQRAPGLRARIRLLHRKPGKDIPRSAPASTSSATPSSTTSRRATSRRSR